MITELRIDQTEAKGGVEDVEVNGASVVENGIAEIDLTHLANKVDHEPTSYTMMDIVNHSFIKLIFGLKDLTIPSTIDPENLKDLYVDIYSYASDENAYWTYLSYNESRNVYALFDSDNFPVHTFYDFGTSTWDSFYQFPELAWGQIMAIDLTSSEWTQEPHTITDFEDIVISEGLITILDLEDALILALNGLVSKLEINQGEMVAGAVMTVNPQGFVVPQTLVAENVFFDKLRSRSLESINVQDAIDELDIKIDDVIDNTIGNLSSLDTTAQSSVVAAINEVNDKVGIAYAVEQPDIIEATQYATENPFTWVFIAK